MQNFFRLLCILILSSCMFAQDITAVHIDSQSKQTLQLKALPESNHCQANILDPKAKTHCKMDNYGVIKITIDNHLGYIAIAVADFTKPVESDNQITTQGYLEKLCTNNNLKSITQTCQLKKHAIVVTIQDAG